jgi:hypothetical protein
MTDTVITRYASAPAMSDHPLMTWETALTPVRRWLSGKLPAVGADNVTGWAATDGSTLPSQVGGTPNSTG